MTISIFTYGSLQFDEVWTRVVRGRYQKSSAVLSNYRLHTLRNETFPAIVPARAADQVNGYVYMDIDTDDLRRLDEFEGDYYRRETVVVSTVHHQTHNALVYVLRDEFFDLLNHTDSQRDCEWDAEQFRREHLADFIKAYL